MKTQKFSITVIILILLVILGQTNGANTANADDSVHVFMDIDFDSAPVDRVYTGDTGSASVWVSKSASAEHVPTGGWRNSGGAKFYPHTAPGQAYCGLAPALYNPNPDRVNLRFLVYYSRDYHNTAGHRENKMSILLRRPYSDETRTWISTRKPNPALGGFQFALNYENTVFVMHGNNLPCNDYPFEWCCSQCIPEASTGADMPFEIADWEEQWIAVEFEAQNTGLVRLYIWTQDGTYDGMYLEHTDANTNDIYRFQIIGGFFNSPSEPGTYFIFDNMKIADSFIGPPEGFFEDAPPPQPDNTGLPWCSSFETGDISEWNGWSQGTLTLSTENPNSGTYCMRIPLVGGTLNGNYIEHYFGDHLNAGFDKVEEVYLCLYSKFSSGYTWPTAQSHKIAILNLTNGTDWQRRYQVYIYVNPNGAYAVDHSYIETWQFFGLPQNTGTPATVNFDTWDKLKLYVRLNTPGNSDGIVRLWVNDVLKVDYAGLSLRENTSFGMNKLILSTYTSHQSGSDGVQWFDDWILATENPAGFICGNDTTPPIRSNPSPIGTLPAGTTQTNISLNTNEQAICKYSTMPEVEYTSMPATFSTTNGTSHSALVTDLENGNDYTYYCKCRDDSGNVNTTDFLINFSIETANTAVNSQFSSPILETGLIGQNSPNPFNPSTTIHYFVAKPCYIQIKIFDQLGRLVGTLVDEKKPVGEHSVTWVGKDGQSNRLTSGIYFYQLRAGVQVFAKKMLYLQ